MYVPMYKEGKLVTQYKIVLSWLWKKRRGTVDSIHQRNRRPGFESRQGIRYPAVNGMIYLSKQLATLTLNAAIKAKLIIATK
jgi:hypothetical protein